MQTERISTNSSIVLLIFCLFLLGTIVPTDPLWAQKGCANQIFGELYLDSNRNDIPEPDEAEVPGPVSIIAEQTPTKETVYGASDGSFQTGDIPCDNYEVKYNGIVIGTFEIGEVMGPVIHYFAITSEIMISSDISPGPDGTSPPVQEFKLYLPLITR